MQKIYSSLLCGLLLCPVTAAFAGSGVSPASSSVVSAEPSVTPAFLAHPVYVGLITGYGETNWNRLVSEDGTSQNATPTSASGGGALIGVEVGYDLTQYIGFEAQYIRFPDVSVSFSPDAQAFIGAPAHMTSKTTEATMIAKASAPFDHNRYAGFADIGYAVETREDVLAGHIHDFRPTFGLGVSYLALQRWTVTAAFSYTPGTGTASDETSAEYIPYLYSGQLILAYRI